MAPRILIIYTGGTIGMIENAETRALEPFNFDHLIENVPKIKLLDIEIESVEFSNPIDSSSMNPLHWQSIAKVIEDNYTKFDGFVVLHGTDTMAYTASALSFMLEHLRKPVIITGSQLPIGEVRTDGEENLITALQIAAAVDPVNGEPMVQEVALLFANYLWRGNRSTKMSADNFNAFKSNNYPPLARIGLGINYNHEALMRHYVEAPVNLRVAMDTNVMFIDLYPGMTEAILRHQFNTPGVKGVVLKTFGAGNTPSSKWFVNVISEAVDRGIVVLNVTQCVNGGVHEKRYVSSDRLAAVGVISGHDITSEAAITKLMFLFGLGLSSDEVKRALLRPIAGEMTVPE